MEHPKCPYCGSLAMEAVPQVAMDNVEYYGSNAYKVCCNKCGGALMAQLHRTVICYNLEAIDFEYDAWGQKPTKTSRKIENE